MYKFFIIFKPINLLFDLLEKFSATYIFTCHNSSIIEHISDRIIVMYFGEYTKLKTIQKNS